MPSMPRSCHGSSAADFLGFGQDRPPSRCSPLFHLTRIGHSCNTRHMLQCPLPTSHYVHKTAPSPQPPASEPPTAPTAPSETGAVVVSSTSTARSSSSLLAYSLSSLFSPSLHCIAPFLLDVHHGLTCLPAELVPVQGRRSVESCSLTRLFSPHTLSSALNFLIEIHYRRIQHPLVSFFFSLIRPYFPSYFSLF